jgi:hypothetical protein
MIVSKIQGGLANQIFQWAYGYSLSQDHGLDLYLDDSFFRGGCKGCTPRTFDLKKFNKIKIKTFEGEATSTFFSKKVYKITDNNFYSSLDLTSLDGNLLLDGFWQSEKYFKKYEDEIVDLLDLQIDSKFNDLNFSGSCSVHIRRTDYLNSPNYHLNLTSDYYNKALEKINPKGNIFVFSDDIQWCKNSLKYPNMIFMEGNTNLEDLKLMSHCEDNIIANSSFSWWAAWLNKNKNKKVIAPSRWFGPEGPSYRDILPNEWIQML